MVERIRKERGSVRKAKEGGTKGARVLWRECWWCRRVVLGSDQVGMHHDEPEEGGRKSDVEHCG